MYVLPRITHIATTIAIAVLAAGPAAAAANHPVAVPAGLYASTPYGSLMDALTKPALVAVDGTTGGLEYWAMKRSGGKHPRTLSGPLGIGYASLAANGNTVIAALESPAEVLLYDVVTQSEVTLPDPFGTPVDVAVGKDGSIYVVNVAKPEGNVAWYPRGSGQAQELSCKYVGLGESIAVDNESDIFVQGYGPKGWTGVAEIPNGPSGPDPGACTKLHLRSEKGTYTGGVTVDPKTDDLVTLDDPDLCAGGYEARLIVYTKPYSPQSGRVRELAGNCTGGLRLNADSTVIFYGDESVSGGYVYIDSATFPQGRQLGTYYDRSSSGPGAFTTIPNTLPN